jgi:hypothetical protein
MKRIAALLVASGCAAKAPPPAAPTAQTASTDAQPESPGARAFHRLVGLEGRWTTANAFPATFARVGRGSAVTQDSGFFVVWYPDGEALAAALFPDDGYHARLRSTQIVEANGELVVELAVEHTGNLVPKKPVARSLVLTLAAGDATVTEKWMFHTDTGDEPFELVLRRATK